ncbi:MAG TPA: hypothetical protein VGQ71_04445 [Terriglobales bacterium]|nr:hypothetical protein [Terriglobales bacterium]
MSKIEPRLEEEIRRMEQAGQTDREIPVILELTSRAPAGQPEVVDFSDLQRQVRAQQQGVVRRLGDLGVKREIRQMTLSNSVETRLTAAQIRQVAGDEEVKRIILNRAEQVTA